jgi:hypothetical protein
MREQITAVAILGTLPATLRAASSICAAEVVGMPVGAGIGVQKTLVEGRRVLSRKRDFILTIKIEVSAILRCETGRRYLIYPLLEDAS